eukprot:403343169
MVDTTSNSLTNFVNDRASHSLSKGATFWFTGLSGAGKSTLSQALKTRLDRMLGDQQKVFVLDGDVIRQGLNKDLGFSAQDRAENIRRISEVSKLFAMSGQICFVAFISPYAKDREFGKQIHKAAGIPFYECFINSSLDVCESRDVKGLYKKARSGEIKNFTGVSDPYESPEHPDLDVKTGELTVEQSVDFVIKRMFDDGIVVSNKDPVIAESLIEESISESERLELDTLKYIEIDVEQAEYLQTLGQGWAAPLNKFMDELQLLEVMHMKTLTDNTGAKHLFSVPITQHATRQQFEELKGESRIALRCPKVLNNEVLAVIENPVFFDNRKEEICARTFGTFSLKHPKVENIMKQGDYLVTGSRMRYVRKIVFDDEMDQYRLTPREINNVIKERQADAVYAFQLRNPLHNGHVLLLKDTIEQLLKLGYKNPILLLHPLGGWVKDDDVPLLTRMKQHQALLDDGTLDSQHTILAIWPSPMYYAGPTEVLWHGSSRANCGITHFITGRDPAGLKHPENDKQDLYDVWHGQKLLVHVKQMINNVEICPFKIAALHKQSETMQFLGKDSKNEEFDFISGTRMRTMAKENQNPPNGFMSQKGWEVLAEYYRNLEEL